jgi:electron transport complex protein RnfG
MTARDMVKIMINLTIIYIVGGVILAYVYAKTSPIMYIKAKEEKEAALKKMMPEAESIEKLGEWSIYRRHPEMYAAKTEGAEIGYVVEGFGKGYSSYINVFTAVDKDFIVQKIDILHHAETPGLGDEIEQDDFINQYQGKSVDHLVVIKGVTDTDIEAITGATISSRAVTEAVREGVKTLIARVTGEGEEEKTSHEVKHD